MQALIFFRDNKILSAIRRRRSLCRGYLHAFAHSNVLLSHADDCVFPVDRALHEYCLLISSLSVAAFACKSPHLKALGMQFFAP
ncbi:hypothetical protein PMI18_02667 [Pseudomonas sp. GM102]|uniref:hypothetical protein n=1 Tax=Pseudomonas sp. GM102 TaxID=1144321 RepID=UPI00026F9B23|nr:hypothetical protein [Pseudomonas sp. GM102]EJM00986.1 hypothetical protein PMI18_02667 [Pseudomonas sp. GM102]